MSESEIVDMIFFDQMYATWTPEEREQLAWIIEALS